MGKRMKSTRKCGYNERKRKTAIWTVIEVEAG